MSLPTLLPGDETRPYCVDLGDHKDLSLDDAGRLARDYTVASRVRMRLCAKRGAWAYDKNLGSRLHELTTRELSTHAMAVVVEALQPLIDEGAITSVDITDVNVDDRTGLGQIAVTFTVPGNAASITVGVPVGG